jgi:hypothetical protein
MGYLNLVDGFVYKDPVFRAKLDALAENDAYLKDNGWNTSTKTVFYQAAVPTGWTQDVTQNDKFLRVVSATGGGSGGSKAPSSTITLAHVHTLTGEVNHTHTFTAHTHDGQFDGGVDNQQNSNDYIVGSGDTDMRSKSTLSGSKTNQAHLVYKTKTDASDQDASSAAGSHNHTLNSALTDSTFAYADVIVGTKDTSSGYTDLTAEFSSGDIIEYEAFVSLAENDDYNYLRLMPSTTVLVFGQASAPTGWTKLATVNDKALRIVSGTGGGTGGVTALSSGLTLAHSHTMGASGGHTHTSGAHRHDQATGSTVNVGDVAGRVYVASNGSSAMPITDGTAVSRTIVKGRSAKDGSGVTSSNPGDHTHSIVTTLSNVTLAYVDVIQCSKDSSGAPYVYEDVTSGVFGFKKLVSKQKLNKLAKNDEHVLFHTTPSGSVAFFFMAAAPITWTKLTTQNDKALRIVSGSSGGSAGGGAQALSSAVTLAHTHSVVSDSHNHTAAHTHAHDTRTEGNAGNNVSVSSATLYVLGVSSGGSYGLLGGSAGIGWLGVKTGFASATGTFDSVSHSHGSTTTSTLSDVTFAYADVIWCSKD